MQYPDFFKAFSRCLVAAMAAVAAVALAALAAAPAQAQVLARADYEAPVTVVVFSAYACPFCQQARGQLDALVQKHPGRVRVVVKNFPLGNSADDFLAHEVALAAAAQGKFKPVHDALFRLGAAALSDRAKLLAAAAAAGADAALIEQDLASGKWREKVEDDIAEAKAFRVIATPTFYVDGFKFEGLQGNGALEQIVEYRMAQAVVQRKPNAMDRVFAGSAATGSLPVLTNARLNASSPAAATSGK